MENGGQFGLIFYTMGMEGMPIGSGIPHYLPPR
jgi:hypothetical protein